MNTHKHSRRWAARASTPELYRQGRWFRRPDGKPVRISSMDMPELLESLAWVGRQIPKTYPAELAALAQMLPQLGIDPIAWLSCQPLYVSLTTRTVQGLTGLPPKAVRALLGAVPDVVLGSDESCFIGTEHDLLAFAQLVHEHRLSAGEHEVSLGVPADPA